VTETIAQIVRAHLGNRELHGAVRVFFDEVDRAIAAQNPICRNRGTCCRFESFGHKLYVTAVELIYFAHGQRNAWWRAKEAGVCPYHDGGKCLARSHRPLGCRIFYCDPETRDWQQEEYERRLGELRRIGPRFGVDYRYVEWLSALREAEEAISLGWTGLTDGIDEGREDMIE
jgi:hypothetical protein